MTTQNFPGTLYSTEDCGATIVVPETLLDVANVEYADFSPEWQEWKHAGDGVYFQDGTTPSDGGHKWWVTLAQAKPLGEEFTFSNFDHCSTSQDERWNNPGIVSNIVSKYKAKYV